MTAETKFTEQNTFRTAVLVKLNKSQIKPEERSDYYDSDEELEIAELKPGDKIETR